MADNAICKKVASMLSLYIDNKVTYQERAFIEEHLANCGECYKKYIYLKSLIKNLKDSYKQVVELTIKKQKQATFNIREHEKFKENLSPYVDNELNAQECFEFRKYLIKSKAAQKELKSMYLMQKEMRIAFDRAKKNTKSDLSKNVINKIKNKNSNTFSTEIVNELFKMRTAKVAILAGLALFGAYEYKHLTFNEKSRVHINQKLLQTKFYKPAKTAIQNIFNH